MKAEANAYLFDPLWLQGTSLTFRTFYRAMGRARLVFPMLTAPVTQGQLTLYTFLKFGDYFFF